MPLGFAALGASRLQDGGWKVLGLRTYDGNCGNEVGLFLPYSCRPIPYCTYPFLRKPTFYTADPNHKVSLKGVGYEPLGLQRPSNMVWDLEPRM